MGHLWLMLTGARWKRMNFFYNETIVQYAGHAIPNSALIHFVNETERNKHSRLVKIYCWLCTILTSLVGIEYETELTSSVIIKLKLNWSFQLSWKTFPVLLPRQLCRTSPGLPNETPITWYIYRCERGWMWADFSGKFLSSQWALGKHRYSRHTSDIMLS